MNTHVTLAKKNTLTSLGIVLIFLLSLLSINSIQAQQRTIRGVITNTDGPLESASVILKGTEVGTTTNSKGEFTFPRPLNTGDVLLITYLGYETQEVKVKADSDLIRLQLTEEFIEFNGAPNSDKPYKSKRSKT